MNSTVVTMAVLASWIPGWVPWHEQGPRPPEIWQGAHAGMTRYQILRVFPAARLTIEGKSLNGEIEGATMPLTVAGHEAIAHFFFLRGGLSAVALSLVDVEEGRTAMNLAEARDLGDAVSHAYGSPGKCGAVNDTTPTRYRCDWASGPLHIELEYREAMPPPTLTVTYRVGVAGTASGL